MGKQSLEAVVWSKLYIRYIYIYLPTEKARYLDMAAKGSVFGVGDGDLGSCNSRPVQMPSQL